MNILHKELNNLPEPNTQNSFDLQKTIIEGALKKKYNHKIKHSTGCNCKFPSLQMCFSYVFSIPNDVLEKNKIYFKPFIKFLVDKKFLLPDKNGLLVIYGKYPVFEHAGIKKDNKIISKWGLGHIWEHDIDEVPEKYGAYQCYKLPDKKLILDEFVEYSKQTMPR